MAKKNEPIGEVECPAKGCALMVPVYRFRPRDNERMQRFANKLYCRCPQHGQFGGAAGDDAMQEYIEANSKKCVPKNEAGSETLPAEPSAVPATVKPANPQKLPAKTTAAVPAVVPELPAEKSKGWGWFE